MVLTMKFCKFPLIVILTFTLSFIINGSFIIVDKQCYAIFEGSANADIFIRVYKQRGDYGRVALWHEAAVECYSLISVPLNDISLKYYKRRSDERWIKRAQKEREEILERQTFHLNSAKAAWKKSETEAVVLKKEREKIAKFKLNWLPHYPDRFYEFGIYATYIRELQEQAEQKRDFKKVINLEADAAEMVAAQYDLILVENGLTKYEKIRDAYLQHAALLRTLATVYKVGTHAKLPDAINRDIGKSIRHKQIISKVLTEKKADEVLQIAKTDPRVKKQLIDQIGIREYAWFQGFAWTVSFYNHGWGNLAIAIIDDKTGDVLDVLIGEHLELKGSD